MYKYLISFAAGAVALAAGGMAFAADMPVKAPSPAPAPVYSWTGWYVGGNIGGSWGDAHTDLAGSGTIITLIIVPTQSLPAAFADSQAQRPNGVIGGGQIGYNYQVSRQWLLGWEADIQGSGERGSGSFSDSFSTMVCIGFPCSVSFTPLNGTAVTSDQAKIEWFGTVRGRAGLLINDGLLLYGTGGLAYGGVSVSGNVNISAAIPGVARSTFGPSVNGFGQSRTNTGFAVGGGMEGRLSAWLSPNWTWKLEYLYVDLGSLGTSTAFATASPFPVVLTPLAGTMTTHTQFTDNIVRVGLNYQFH